MQTFYALAILLFSAAAAAKDCATVQPFKSIGSQKVHVSVMRLFWTADGQEQEDVCSGDVTVSAFDVRGREDDAYYCLKPAASSILGCSTTLDGEKAEVSIVPASWIRSWKPKAVREYRLHTYVVKAASPDFYIDVFSRSLTTKLKAQNLIVEGALRTGPANQGDGYFVRAEFKK